MKVLEQRQTSNPLSILAVREHEVEPEAGYCLVCRRGIQRLGLTEWSHRAS